MKTLPADVIESDWRFAAIVARTHIEPDFAARYETDPHAVLREFGLHIDTRTATPKLPVDGDRDLHIEELGRAGLDFPFFTLCYAGTDVRSAPASVTD
jgi:hypothetical protein